MDRNPVLSAIILVAGARVASTCAACSGTRDASGLVPSEVSSGGTSLPQSNARAPSSLPHYTAIALPSTFAPVAIMPDGAIAGSVGNQAAVYRGGHVRFLGHYSGFANNTVATSVNNSGDAVGYAIAQPYFFGSPTVALYFSNGHMTVLNVPDEPIATATNINNSNQILGTCTDSTSENLNIGPYLCTFRSGGHGQVAFISNGAWGNINNHGEYVASLYYDYYANLEGLLYAVLGYGTKSQDLFAFRPVGDSALQDTASWINEYGNIVGSSQQVTNPNITYAYIIKSGHLSLIRAPGAQCTNANSINKFNQIVGNDGSPGFNPVNDAFACFGSGFFWESGHIYDLNALVAGRSLGLNNAIGIDDRGDILATGASGKAYLLTS